MDEQCPTLHLDVMTLMMTNDNLNICHLVMTVNTKRSTFVTNYGNSWDVHTMIGNKYITHRSHWCLTFIVILIVILFTYRYLLIIIMIIKFSAPQSYIKLKTQRNPNIQIAVLSRLRAISFRKQRIAIDFSLLLYIQRSWVVNI